MSSSSMILNKVRQPEAGKLVWCRRQDGRLLLAVRIDKPLSTNSDSNCDCHWYGVEREEKLFLANRSGLDFTLNFSDVTVDCWVYV